MRTPGRLLLLAAWAALSAVVLGGCASARGDAARYAGPPRHGGDLVVGIDQEPGCLDVLLVCGSQVWGSAIFRLQFDPMFEVDRAGRPVPVLAAAVPTRANGLERVEGGDLVVDVPLRAAAHWNDGVPVTCDDVRFTRETMLSTKWLIVSRNGWQNVRSVTCPRPKLARFRFRGRYAPWLSVVSTQPLPAHELRGRDLDRYWNDRLTVGSGPFRFDHWSRHVELTMRRDPHYWNAGPQRRPYLDRVSFHFLVDTNSLKIGLRARELDLIFPPPDTNLPTEMASFPNIGSQTRAGNSLEALVFNSSRAPTRELSVRQAVAWTVDRQQLAERVLRGQVGVLQSTVLPDATTYYSPAWSGYRPDAARARAALQGAGWRRHGKWWTRDGHRLVLRFVTTSGNVLRLKVAQLLQQQLAAQGIDMRIELQDPSVLFSVTTPAAAFDMGEFAGLTRLDPSQTLNYACSQRPTARNHHSGTNTAQYCDRASDALMRASDAQVDVARRTALLRQLQARMAERLPVLPLFARPETAAWNLRLHGVVSNPLAGRTWNVADWWVAGPR